MASTVEGSLRVTTWADHAAGCVGIRGSMGPCLWCAQHCQSMGPFHGLELAFGVFVRRLQSPTPGQPLHQGSEPDTKLPKFTTQLLQALGMALQPLLRCNYMSAACLFVAVHLSALLSASFPNAVASPIADKCLCKPRYPTLQGGFYKGPLPNSSCLGEAETSGLL